MQNKIIQLGKQLVIFEDLGIIHYKDAWDYQEEKLNENLKVKSAIKFRERNESLMSGNEEEKGLKTSSSYDLGQENDIDDTMDTRHYLLFCEHPPVYTLGKSGHIENVLLQETELADRHIEFFRTNRGGDITFHGLQQLVGYPILDLEKFITDIGVYLRNLEEVIIRTIAEYGIKGSRSKGETGVWVDPEIPGKERKICAMGIRCSRWVTMHGFALNVNTDLDYFKNIIPCGIVNKKVTSIKQELGYEVDFLDLKEKILVHFEAVFQVEILKNKDQT